MNSRSSFRWRSSQVVDVDAYQSAGNEKEYALFFIFKEPVSGAEEEIAPIVKEFESETGVKVVLAGGAAKERDSQSSVALPKLLGSSAAFAAVENDTKYALAFEGVLNPGLFLDQRENRSKMAAFLKPGGRVLNLFSYTCAFSVVAAKQKCRSVNVDSSKKYLEWGKRNFALNGLEIKDHLFFAQDAAEFLRRARKKAEADDTEKFDCVILDPPTFSRSGSSTFQVQRDFPPLLDDAVAVLRPGGKLLASCNDSRWAERDFRKVVESYGKAESAPASSEFPKEHPFKGFWLAR